MNIVELKLDTVCVPVVCPAVIVDVNVTSVVVVVRLGALVKFSGKQIEN
jgi:hypothetical protein